MRVLYHHRTMADGAEGIHIREIVLALRTLGHDVLVEALAGDPTQRGVVRASRLGMLRKLIPTFAYEIAELGYNAVGHRRLMAAIHAFRPDVIYDRYNSYSTAALTAARRAGLPLLLEVNAPVAYERSVYEHLRLHLPWLAQRYEKSIFNGADRIFAVSTPLKRYLVDTLRIDPHKIIVLPNGADPDVFAPASGRDVRLRHGIDNRTVIGFVGILRPWHGVDLLLDAFRDLRTQSDSVHLLIVGDGPMRDPLEAHARRLGLVGAVTFTDRITHAEVGAYIAAMDVCVSPHATFYASPMKVLEYMSMGKPVIAPAMDNIRDIIEDGRNGTLFEPGKVGTLTAAMRSLVEDVQLRRALGERARRSVVDRFNWRCNALAIAETAGSLIEQSVDVS